MTGADRTGRGDPGTRGDAGQLGEELTVHVPAGPVALEGTLSLVPGAVGVVLFAHGSGSGRHSPRNRHVAAVLRGGGLATLLVDLLTADEEAVDARTRHLRFDIELLAVGGDDVPVLALNREAAARMTAPVDLEVVPGATHLFEEPGALDEVARLARGWFARHLGRPGA